MTKDQSQLEWENRLAKFYWTPCGSVVDGIDWALVDGTQGFTEIPKNSKGEVKGLEVGGLRDIVATSYRLGQKHAETKTIEKCIVVVEDYACRLFNCPDPEELSEYRPQGRDFQRSHYNLVGAIQALKELLPKQ